MKKTLRRTEEARRPTPKNDATMADSFPCSWWRYTGAMSPFVMGISSPVLRNLETGEEKTYGDLPIGALWVMQNPPTMPEHYQRGYDDASIACKLPDGRIWHIDGRANNCTLPADEVHRCWVRHGGEGERVTVDKKGNTCQAGAGSIKTEKYHGFLRNHQLVRS